MDGNLDALNNWANQTLGKTPKDDNPQAREKILRASRLAKNYGYDIPDDVADEFYQLTKHESGRSHYLKDGKTVKTGARTPNGDYAIGFSQVMGNTAKPYQSKGLDPYKEDDNLIIGLNEFYNGDKQDPVGRRLAYVGGAHSSAYKNYKQTGEISEGKLYSYLPNNKETFGDYVRKSGGLSNLHNWAEQTLNGGGSNNTQMLNDWAEQTLSGAANPQRSPNLDDWASNVLGQINTPQAVGEGATVSTDLATGEIVPKGTQTDYQTFGIKSPIRPVDPRAHVANANPTANLPKEQTETLGGLPETDSAFPVAAPNAPLTLEDADKMAARISGTEDLPKDYLEYLKARQMPDSPELRNDYSETMKAAPEAYLPTAQNYQQQLKNAETENSVAQENYQRQLAEYNAKYKPTGATPPTVMNRDAPNVLKPGTYENIRESENSGQRISIDLSKVSGDKNAYINSETAKQIAAAYDVPEADALEVLEKYPLMKGDGTAYTAEEIAAKDSANFKITPKLIEEVRAKTDERDAAMRRNAAAEQERQRLEAENAEREAALRQRAIEEIKQENIDNRLIAYDENGNMMHDAETGKLLTPVPTEDEINQRVEELRRIQLDEGAVHRAVDVGERNKQYGFGGEFLSATYGGAGRAIQSAAGLARPLASLGFSKPYEWLSKTGSEMQLAGQTTNGDSWSGTAADLVGGLPFDLARLSILSKLPGGMVVGFSADHALSAAGRGANSSAIKREAAKGALMGGIFAAAKPIAGKVSDVFRKNAVDFVDAFPSNAAYKTVNAAQTLVREGTEIAVIGHGIYQISKAFGSTDEEADKEMIANALFHVAGKVKAKAFDKIYKIWNKGKASDVYVDPKGKVKLLKGEVAPDYVDAEIVSDPNSNAYKASESAKRIGKEASVEDFDANQSGNVPNNDVAAYNRTPAERLNGSQNAQRELAAENPRRIEVAQPEAMQKIALDTRAQKIIENLRDGKTYTIEQLQKATKYNKTNVEETLLTLYSAKQIEILPDNSVRFIGGESPANNGKSLFERAAEIESPKQNINLPKSPVENEIVKSGFADANLETVSDKTKFSSEANSEKVSDLSIYEALPQQKRQEAQIEKPKAQIIYDERPNLTGSSNSVPTASGKIVRVGEREVDLTNEQAERWKTEVEEPLEVAKRWRDADIKQNPRLNAQRANEVYKGEAMRIAAIKREITGEFTAKEKAEKIRREKSNYIGKSVSVNNRNGKVVGVSFGKVKVQFDDGSEKRFEPSEIGAPVTPEKPKPQIVFTERGRKASIAPKVVEQSDLLTSLDEGYPPEFQPRDRSRAASKAQVSEIANRLNPEFLGDSPKASDGRPLVVPVQMPDGATKYAVISGNGRTAGIREAYNLGNDGAKSYKTFAQSKGGKDLQQPVYVGVMNPNEINDFSEFAKEANESATAQMSASEQAKSDADRLDASVLNLFVPSDDGTIHGAANRDFVRAFLDKTTSTSERNRYIDSEGKLNQEGVTKVKNAIFAKAFGSSEMGMATLQRMAESTDSNIKNITNALLAKAGELSSFAEAAKDNRRFKDADIAPDFARAMEKYSELKEAGTSIDEYIRQGALFGADTSPLQTRVMQVFDHYKRRSKSIKGIIDNYIKAAEALGDPNQRGLFGDNDKPSKESIFEAAVRDYEKYDTGETAEEVGLFNQNQGRENQSGARQESDAAVGETAPAGKQLGNQTLNVGDRFKYGGATFEVLPSGQYQNKNFYRIRNTSTGETFNKPFRAADIARLERVEPTAAEKTQFAVARENVAPQSVREKIFAGRVKKLAADAPAADILIAKSKFETKDGTVLLNPEATEYVRQMIGNMFGESQPAFLGAYLKPEHIEMFSNYLENDLPKSGLRPFAVNKAKALLNSIVKAADAVHNDAVILSNSPEFPDGLLVARQEEFGHRFNARSGVSEKFTEDVIEDVEESYQNVEKDYSDYSVRGKLDETFAKSLRDDAENALGVSKATARNNRRQFLKLVADGGINLKEAANELKNISRKGEGLAKYVERYGDQRFGRDESINTRDTRTLDSLPRGNADVRRRRLRDGGRPFGEDPDRFARLRQTENLGANRSGNESLAVRVKNEILFDRVSDIEIEPEEVKAETERSTKSLLSYIYDGKRDVSPTEAAMNIMRTGYLAGLSVIKTNLVGNTSNIVAEQLAKPLMATADILNPKAKTRTTPGLSPRDVIEGFFGKDGFFRAGFTGDKGVITALVKGVDHQESARVDMNVADKNTNFVRNTGVPLIDVVIEATKRVVTGVDRPFKAYARSAEKSGLARLEASKEKLAGLEWRKRMNDLRNSPTAYINDVAERYAETVTFQNPNAATAAYDKFRRFLIDEKAQARIIPAETQRKIAKYVGSATYLATGQMAPFMSTPSNVGFRTLEYFFPTGIVAAAYKFHRIGQSFERRNFVEEQGLNRSKVVKRLAAVRGSQDRIFNSETNAKKERLSEQKKIRTEAFKREIEAVKNSKVFTDAAKTTRIEQLKTNRDKWLEGWEKNREKYLQERQTSADKATAQRKVVDEITKKNWESEDAYADLKFSAFENRAFAEAAGRAGFGATVGSLALLGVIYGLIKAVGTTNYDDEKEKAKEKRAVGIPDDSIAIFGYRFPYADFPFGNALKMGINLFEQYERPGNNYDRASAMAKRFGKDVTSLNPLTEQGFTKKDWSSYAGSKANSMTPILNLKILQELGEVLDDKPRKYWEEGFAAQYLIKLPYLRENLPESESFIGGEEERGDVWRRALRAIDPLKTTKEGIDQSELPNTPLSKQTKADPGKDKKLDDAVRKGKISTDEATRILTDDVNRGDISPSQYKQRVQNLSQSKAVKQMTDADASNQSDFNKIEKIIKESAPEDREMLEKVLIDKTKAKINSKTNKGIADGQKLLEIHDRYFPLNQ